MADTASSKLHQFLYDLGRQVRGDLRSDEYSRVLYSTDASLYQVMPQAVLIPRTSEDVHAAVELAAAYHVPIVARAGGSSLAGQVLNEALIIDFTRHLNRVLELNREAQWVRVQAGLVLDDLNLFLRAHGLQFGPDPASSNRAAMGGIVSNNATGSHSIVYGMAADHVLGAKVLLDDGTSARLEALEEGQLVARLQSNGREGEIYRHFHTLVRDATNQQTIIDGTPRHWRRCGGYNLDRFVESNAISSGWPRDPRFNLAKLIAGAEGTLAVITELKLNLVPRPPLTALAIVHFDALYTALTAVPAILETNPSAVELLDNLGLTLCRDVPEYARLLKTFLEGQPHCILITEFSGESQAELEAKIERLRVHLRRSKAGTTAVTTAMAPRLQANVWKVRKGGLGLLMSIKGDQKPIPFIEDAAVPTEHLAEYVSEIERFCSELDTQVAYYAHASAGCLHIRPLINTKVASEVAKLPEITAFCVELLRGYGGVLSSEHGDGRSRSWINERFFGPELYRLYQQTKQIFDPHGIFNPGNIVDAGPMTANLRFGADHHALPLQTHIDFTEHGTTPAGGFDRAVEMCNGAGVCRQKQSGTMCPSFMVTHEEMHSTRGRANLLRAAMSGTLPRSELTSPRMYAAMDLCIECKACKAECPSAVDMAKIKFEFLAHYHESHSIPLRTRLFAHIGTLNRLASGPLAPLANHILGNGVMRQVMERTLGISARRKLPPFARQSFSDWFEQHATTRTPPNNVDRVALFHDPFTNYNYPHVGVAATEVLEAAGFDVILPRHREDGRSFISKGLVHEARAIARDTVAHLAPLAEDGVPIVGLEPSSLLTLRDEYLYLLPGDPRAPLIAQHTYTFEEFIAQLADTQRLNLSFTPHTRHVLLHGHCHQKALVGTGPSMRTLTLPPNYTVEEVDSGCCGMAGAFGYEVEHIELSLQMAERRLLPAVRNAEPETLIAAAGVSCRQQIEHATGRRAFHPAEILRNALA